jgi:glutaredoxin
MNVTIYGTSSCAYCDKAKNLCKSKGLEYSFVNIEEDSEQMFQLLDAIGPFRTVPQVFIDDEHVGGFDKFEETLNG